MSRKKISNVLKSMAVSRFAVPAVLLGALITLWVSLIAATGKDPGLGIWNFLYGTLGTAYGVADVLTETTPLLLTGLAVLLAFKSRIFNLGAEGQLQMGALVTTLIGITFVDMPLSLLFLLVFIGSFLSGGVWALIAGVLKVKLNVNEVLTSIMLNYVAFLIVEYMISGPIKDPTEQFNRSPLVASSIFLPKLIPGTRLHVGILISVAFAVLVYLLLRKTVLGFDIRVTGANPRAAYFSGIDVTRVILITMIASGGLAGIAGMVSILGVHHRLISGFSPWYGYTGITVAWLANLRPSWAILTAFVLGLLSVGTDMMQIAVGIPVALARVIEGLTLVLIVTGQALGGRRSE